MDLLSSARKIDSLLLLKTLLKRVGGGAIWALLCVGLPAMGQTLGTGSVVLGPNSGASSVVLAYPSQSWTATANATWLHFGGANFSANLSGSGSANIIFFYDANPGGTRGGSLTIAGQTFTVTQAGFTYVAAGSNTLLVSAGLSAPQAVAVDTKGNVYISDSGDNTVKEWIPSVGNLVTLISSGLSAPHGVAVDGAGNVYVADSSHNTIVKWTATSHAVTNLVSTGLNGPEGVAVDSAGNLYIADTGDNEIKMWLASTGTLAKLLTSGLEQPEGVALDAADNIYIADFGDNTVKEFMQANSDLTTLVSKGLKGPVGVAVNGAGNVYIDDDSHAIRVLTAASGLLTTLINTEAEDLGLAVDSAGNVYTANFGNVGVTELPFVFVDPTPKVEPVEAGSDVLPVVLPVTADLFGPFAPSTDQSWLAITGITNDVVSFSFDVNSTGQVRTGHILLLNESIPITQAAASAPHALTHPASDITYTNATVHATVVPEGADTTAYFVYGFTTNYYATNAASDLGSGTIPVAFSNVITELLPSTVYHYQVVASNGVGITLGGDETFTTAPAVYTLGTTNRLESPAGGFDSVILGVAPPTGSWTNTVNAAWLHISEDGNSGEGSTVAFFTFDANSGPTRIGTLTIGGQTVTVTQAGSTYAQAGAVTSLVSSGLNAPYGVAVDGAGNVYIADTGNNAIKEWSPVNNNVTTLVSSGLDQPEGIAVDGLGNVYIADTFNSAVKEFMPANNSVTQLVGSRLLLDPGAVAVDETGNVYIADSGNNAIKEWSPSTSILTTLVVSNASQPVSAPAGVAVDAAGNVYFSDFGDNGVDQLYFGYVLELATSNSAVPVDGPSGMAVDGAGDVYFADRNDNAIDELIVGGDGATNLVSSGLSRPEGVAVDGSGNVYIADTSNNEIKELPYAFVELTPRFESAAPGSDTLPAVLPSSENLRGPFSPTSDQSWLTIHGVANGAVSFTFTGNGTGGPRAAHISLLGRTISVTQVPNVSPPSVTLFSPPNGVFYFEPSIIPLDAQALAPAVDDYIQNVGFYATGPAIGTNVLVAEVDITNALLDTNFISLWTNAPPGNYVMDAVALDSYGERVISTPSDFTVYSVILVNGQYTNTGSFTFSANNPPVVTMTGPPGTFIRYTTNDSSPTNGQLYANPLTIRSSVLVRAAIFGPNGVPLEEVPPVHITIIAGSSLPVVSMISPTNGASFSVSNSITLQASVVPANGVTGVSFYIDGQPVGQDPPPPYTLQIPPDTLLPGSHSAQASAVVAGSVTVYSPLVHFTINEPGMVLIDFDALNTSAGAVSGALLSNYLAGYGVTLSDVTGGTVMDAVNTNSMTGNVEVEVPSAPNFFTQNGSDQPVSFTLNFRTPLQTFGFTRPGLSDSFGEVSHPHWTATAFDSNGVALSSFTEGLILSSEPVPAKSFVLPGNGMASVRFDSDSQQTAAFSAVLLDDLVLGSQPVAPPLSISFSASPTSPTAPATVTLNARVMNQLSGSSAVSFFAGANFLGTVSNSPYRLVLTNVLAGNYAYQASALDPSGQAAFSAVAPVTVQPVANSALVNFDTLNTSRAPVSGTAVNNYLAAFGITVSNLSPGTQLTVYSQKQIAGGSATLAASPPNLLTQTGSSGPVQFTLSFTLALNQFGFTRPELLANPFVSHPAWQATAFNGAGTIVGQVGEGQIDSATNVGASEFTLGAPGASIATVQFTSEGTGLTTFNAMLVDDLLLTTNPPGSPPALSVAITQPISGQALAAPPAVTIMANAADKAGVGQVSFYANGVLLGTDTATPFSVLWNNPAPGNYALTAIASRAAGGVLATSQVVNIVIQPSANVFGISGQPVDQTVAVGGEARFSVGVTGAGNATYQWYTQGAAIAGATSSSYVVGPPVALRFAGVYFATVTAQGVTLNSRGARLTVVAPPTLTTQPVRQTVPAGTDVALSVTASGVAPLTYQWLLNRNVISGATNSSYFIAGAQPRQSGNYQVMVANQSASILSGVAPLIVETLVTIPETNLDFTSRASINPLLSPVSDSNQLATIQSGAPLPDGVPGGNSIWFTWTPLFTGTVTLTTQGSDFDTVMAVYTGTQLNKLVPVAADDDSGGFLASLVTFNVTAGTSYQIAVDGNKGASGRVVLGLPAGTGYEELSNSLPVIVKQPASLVVAFNAKVTLTVQAASPSKLGYQWYFQGAPIPFATGASFSIAHASDGMVGAYYVLATNAAGSAQSEPAIVQIALDQGAKTTSTGSKFLVTGNTNSPVVVARVLQPEAFGGDTGGFSVSQVFSTVGATSEPGQPEPCGQPGGASEWFYYAAPTTGQMVVTTEGSDFSTVLGLYSDIGGGNSFSNLAAAGCGYTTNYLTQAQPSIVTSVAKGAAFYILVEGYQGDTGMAQLQVALGNPLEIGAAPASQLVTPGNNAAFQVAATGSTPISYQWQLNGINLAGATKSAYTVTKAQSPAEGNYTVIVSNALGTVTSAPPAALTLQFAPAIVSGPTNETVKVGQTAKFVVTAVGVNVKTNPFVFQWYSTEGERVPKATGMALSFPDVSLTNAGAYYLVISNSYGAVTSAPAILTVVPKTSPKAVTDDNQVTYNGLFYPASGATKASSGFFTATVNPQMGGVFSAHLLLDGGSYSLTGQFDSFGNAGSIVMRPGQTSVSASLHLNLDPLDDQMTGTVSNADWISVLQAGRAAAHPPVSAGMYAMVLTSQTGSALGYLTVTNSSAGTALVTGTFYDGTGLFRAAPVNEDATIPLYAPLYSGQGLFLGWITLTNGNPGKAAWIKSGGTNATRVFIVK